MHTNIEKIISIERSETDNYIKKQNARLMQLRDMQQKKKNGEAINTKPILEGLQKAGILDEFGKLAYPYRD